MKTVVDERLEDESARFALRHCCDDCVHFDGARCGNAWPTAPHRLPVVREASPPESGKTIVVFCKEFEAA